MSLDAHFHSDRDDQAPSRKLRRTLVRLRMLGSMGQVGPAGDNAAIETLFSPLQQNDSGLLDQRCPSGLLSVELRSMRPASKRSSYASQHANHVHPPLADVDDDLGPAGPPLLDHWLGAVAREVSRPSRLNRPVNEPRGTRSVKHEYRQFRRNLCAPISRSST